MKSRLAGAQVLVFVAALGAAARADDPVDVDARGEPLGRVLDDVARRTGQDVAVAPALRSTSVRFTREGLPVGEAVGALARAVGAEVEALPGGVLFVRPAQPVVEVELRDVPAGRALARLAEAADGELLYVGPDDGPPVTAAVAGTWPEVAARVARLAGLELAWRRGAAVVGAPLPGEPPPGPDGPADAPGAPVSLDVDDVDLFEAGERVGRAVGRNVLVDPDVRARVTVLLRDVPWRHAVEVLARLGDCRVEDRGHGILLLVPRARHDLRAAGVRLAAWLELLAAADERSVAVAGGVRGRVWARLRRLAPDAALRLSAVVGGGAASAPDEDVVVVTAPDDVGLALPPLAAGEPGGRAVRALLERVDGLARTGDAAGLERALAELERRVRQGAAAPSRPAFTATAVHLGYPRSARAVVGGRVYAEGDRGLRSSAGGEGVLAEVRPGTIRLGSPGRASARYLAELGRSAPEDSGQGLPPEGAEDAPLADEPLADEPLEDEPLEDAPLEDAPLDPLAPLPPPRPLPRPPEGPPPPPLAPEDRPPEVDDPAGGPARLHVDVEDADLADVVVEIGREAGRPVVVAAGVEERITVSLRDIPWREALDVIARMCRCRVDERGGLLVVNQPALVTTRFPRGDVRGVLRRVARLAGHDVVLAGDVAGTVRVALDEVRGGPALRAIAEAAGLHLGWLGECAVVSREPLGLPADPSRAGRPAPNDAPRFHVSVEDAPVREVLAHVARAAGVPIEVGPDVAGRISAALADVAWPVAVDYVAWRSGCRVEALPGGGARVTQPPRVTLRLDEADAREVAGLVAASAGKGLLAGPAADGAVSVELSEVPWDDAVRAVALAAGLEARPVDEATFALSAGGLPSPPVAGGDGEAWARLRGAGAPATGWYRLLADCGGFDVDVDAAVGGAVTVALSGATPRQALALTAWVHGHDLEERPGGRVRIGPAPPTRAPPAPTELATGARLDAAVAELARAVDARDPAWLTEALARLRRTTGVASTDAAEPTPDPAALAEPLDELLRDAQWLARAGRYQELIAIFARLRAWTSERGLAGARALHEAVDRWEDRLADLAEVALSLRLQAYLAEGNHHLRALALAVREERFAAAVEPWDAIQEVVARMRARERDVFHRNADALELRGAALHERAARLALLEALPLGVTAIAVAGTEGAPDRALVGGRVAREGDPVTGPGGAPLEPTVRVVRVGPSTVTFRSGVVDLVRAVGAE